MVEALTPRMREVLAYLKEHRREVFTSGEIAEAMNLGPKNAASYLSQIYRYGAIRRYPYNGKSYKYQYAKDAQDRVWETIRPNANVLDEYSSPASNLQKLTAPNLEQMLTKWADSPWSPKIFASARNLPLALARLYQLSCEASYGAVVDQSAIDEARLNLSSFAADLEQTLLVVKSVLATQELWKAKKLVDFLGTAARAEHLQHVALRVKEAN